MLAFWVTTTPITGRPFTRGSLAERSSTVLSVRPRLTTIRKSVPTGRLEIALLRSAGVRIRRSPTRTITSVGSSFPAAGAPGTTSSTSAPVGFARTL